MALKIMENGAERNATPAEEAEIVAFQADATAAQVISSATAALAVATQQFPDWAEDVVGAAGVAGKLSPQTQALLVAKQQARAALIAAQSAVADQQALAAPSDAA